jgi:hypothetical protein
MKSTKFVQRNWSQKMEQLGWIVIRAILTPVEENKQQKKSISGKDLPTDIILRRSCQHSNPGRLGAGLPHASASQSTRESMATSNDLYM